MKKLLIWLVLPVLLSAGMCSEEDKNELTGAVGLEKEFEREFTANTGPDTVYTISSLFDVKAQSPDFVDISSKVSTVEIKEISYEILDGTTPGVEIKNLEVYVSDSSVKTKGGAKLLAKSANIKIDDAKGKKTAMNLSDAGSDELKKLLKNDPYQVKYWAYGVTNTTGATIKLKVYSKVKATPDL